MLPGGFPVIILIEQENQPVESSESSEKGWKFFDKMCIIRYVRLYMLQIVTGDCGQMPYPPIPAQGVTKTEKIGHKNGRNSA